MKRKKNAVRSRAPFQESLLLQILHNNPAVIWVVDLKGLLTFIEGKGLELLGLQPKDLLGKSIYDLYSDHPLIEHSIQRVLKGESFSMPVQLQGFHFEHQLMPLRDKRGKITHIVGISIDVTGRRLDQEKLKVSQEKFRNLIENSHDVINLFSPDGTLLYVSPSVRQMLGYKPEEVLGQNGWMFIHPEDLEKRKKGFDEVAKIPNLTASGELRIRHKDGSWRTVDATIVNLLHEPSVKSIVANYRDVTDRKKAETKLLESEEQFRRVFENAPLGVAMVEKGKFHKVNRVLCDMLGYEDFELIGKSFVDITHPDDIEESKRKTKELWEGKTRQFAIRKRYVHKNGSVVWANTSVTEIRDSKDQYRFNFAIIENISESKKAEEALRKSEERFREIFQKASIGMTVVDSSYHFADVNQAFCDMVGYSKQELASMTFKDITHPDDLGENIALADALPKSGGFKMQKRYIHKNGNVIWLNLTVTSIFDEQHRLLYSVGMIENISEQKKAIEALRASEENFRNLIEKSPDAMIVHRSDRIYYVNRAFLDLTGYHKAEDLIGQSPVLLMPPGERADINGRIQNLDRMGQYNPSMERSVVRKDKSSVPVEVASFSILFNGEVVAVAVMRDLTERKNMEQALLKYVRLGAIGEVATGMAHEIRNPLSGIMLSAQYLSLTVGSTPEVLEQIQNILDQCERLKNLVNDTLDFSRDKATEARRRVDQKELFQTAMRLAQSQYGPDCAKYKIRSVCDGGSHFLNVNPFRIQQVLVNLIVNAFQALGEGGTVTLACREQGGILRLSVMDDGCGISEENLPRLFEPFFTTKKNGSGLGLSVSQKIAEAHGGKILVERLEPRGTAFHIELPVRTEGSS